jgi:type I restriction enzyme S subunit
VGAITWSATAFFPIDTVFYVESEWPVLFLLHLLRRQKFQNSDAAVPGLNRNAALRMPIGIPPPEFAFRFDTLAAPKLAMAEKLSASNKRLAAARDLLLPRLISGELTVADAERTLETAA